MYLPKIYSSATAILLGCLTFQISAADNLAAQLPDMGDAGSSILSPLEEKQLGREFMWNVRQNLDLVDDPLSETYLQNLANKLQSKTDNNILDIRSFIVNDPSLNAFAGPGGYIGVHTGLILAARSEGELASVMAHEIAHVTQRHLVRAFEASSKMSLSTMGAIFAAILLGGHNPQVSEAILASSLAGSAQQQLTYSRAHEQEADRVGLELLASADIDPRHMVSFFDILQQQTKSIGPSAPEFLRTHPLTLSRIADTRNRAMQYPQKPDMDDTAFQLIQARIAVLTKRGAEINPFNITARAKEMTPAAQHYYQVLSAFKSNDYTKARQLIQPLLQANTRRVLYYYTAAQIELADQKPDLAQDVLNRALKLFPGNPELTLLYAEALLQTEQAQLAFDTLKTALRQRPDQFNLYKVYAKAATQLGNNTEAYRALGEYQYASGNTRQAVEYLTQALKAGTMDRYEQLSLEARLKSLKSEIAQNESEISPGSKN